MTQGGQIIESSDSVAGTANIAEAAVRRKASPAEVRLLEASSLFDAGWYAARHPEVPGSGMSPAIHYLEIGAAKGFAPSPGFDGADYHRRYPDIARAGLNPLLHFLTHGQKEGRKITPADPEETQLRILAASGLFDEDWYVAAYPEVSGSGLSPLRFFLKHGRDKGHNPSPRFDAAAYVETYADVAGSGVNPLLHYMQFGRAEGRAIFGVRAAPSAEASAETLPEPVAPAAPAPLKSEPRLPVKASPADLPDRPAAQAGPASRETANARLIMESGLFDAQWYAASNPDVAASGLAPEIHYLRVGGPLGLAPSPHFDGADYLARNRDVRQAGLNPLLHYLAFGRTEKRPIRHWDPIESLVAPIEESGLYDEEWYVRTYPEVVNSKLSPLRHFIKHGREKGHNPSAAFDCAAYIADNPELTGSPVNALAHYLQVGKSRGRPIFPVQVEDAAKTAPAEVPAVAAPRQEKPPAAAASPAPQTAAAPVEKPRPSAADLAADLALLEASPLFDAEWYLRKYPDVARSGLSAAEHYLRYGTAESRLPGILFDPQFYVSEQCPEIQQTGVNPLLHFIKEGQKRGMKPRALFQAAVPEEPFRPLSPSSWPLAAAGSPPSEAPGKWTRYEELASSQAEGSLLAGRTLIAPAPAGNALTAAKARLSAFRAMSGLSRDTDFAIIRDGSRDVLPETGFEARAYKGLGPGFASGPAKLVDAWYAADQTLRLRLGEDGKTFEGLIVLRAFQSRAEGNEPPVLVGEAAVEGAPPCFVDLALVSPFMPVLLVLSTAEGHATEIGLLPFPSLCRGGRHYAELIGTAQLSNPLERLLTVSDSAVSAILAPDGGPKLIGQLKVSLRGATGAEPIFAKDFVTWVARVFGIGLSAAEPAGPETAGEEYLRRRLSGTGAGTVTAPSAQFALVLPPDTLPTISALAAPAGSGGASTAIPGDFFVTDGLSARPRLSVQLPRNVSNLLPLQPEWASPAYPVLEPLPGTHMPAPSVAVPATGQPHLAIRFASPGESHRAAVFMPLAPDSADPVIRGAPDDAAIDVLIRVSNPGRLETLVKSLLLQHGVRIGFVRAEQLGGVAEALAVQTVLDALVPDRSDVLTVPRYRPIGADTVIAGSTSECTLVVDDTVVLHDRRTLSTLLALIGTAGTASAGCVMLREVGTARGTGIQFESGGYFPSHVSLLSAPRLILSLPDTRGALPAATYPVAANDPSLLLASNAVLAAIETGASTEARDSAGLAFSLHALASGYRHLCTSAVRATVTGPVPPREAADPPGIGRFEAASWETVLNGVTVLRELH